MAERKFVLVIELTLPDTIPGFSPNPDDDREITIDLSQDNPGRDWEWDYFPIEDGNHVGHTPCKLLHCEELPCEASLPSDTSSAAPLPEP